MSAGGGISLYLALRCPELFGNVIAQTSACAYSPPGEHWTWLARQFGAADIAPLNVMLSAGLIEVDRVGEIPCLLDANIAFNGLLNSLGHQSEITLLACGHDLLPFREDLGRALLKMFGRMATSG